MMSRTSGSRSFERSLAARGSGFSMLFVSPRSLGTGAGGRSAALTRAPTYHTVAEVMSSASARRSLMPGRLPIFLALVCLALVAALGLTASPIAAQTTVRVASAGIASDIGFFLALKKGYFRDEGLNVELTQMAN